MKRFLFAFGFCSLGFLMSYSAFYYSADLYFNSKSAENSLFIWGDSQAYRGIDLKVLRQGTNKTVYSAARHGAGVYDFHVFAEKVPSNSEVLVALSKPVQLRRKERDRNMSGFSLMSLLALLQHKYSFAEVLSVAKKNIKPSGLYLKESRMYEFSDSVVIAEPIKLFEEIYKDVPPYLDEKQNLYLEGIRTLKGKGCKVHLIEFPYHELLKDIEKNSVMKQEINAFASNADRIAGCTKQEVIILEGNKQFMHDLTHLNGLGARLVSQKLSEKLQGSEQNTFCFEVIID